MKYSIDKIKAVLAEINKVTKGTQNEYLIKVLTRALDVSLEGFKEIYADGSYEDIASEISEKKIKEISEILECK